MNVPIKILISSWFYTADHGVLNKLHVNFGVVCQENVITRQESSEQGQIEQLIVLSTKTSRTIADNFSMTFVAADDDLYQNTNEIRRFITPSKPLHVTTGEMVQ